MEIVRNRIDLEKEIKRILDFPYKLFIMKGSREELNKIISQQNLKEGKVAKVALELIKNMDIIDADGASVDERLIQVSGKDTIIATQDRELKKRLKGQMIVVRQKMYLRLI